MTTEITIRRPDDWHVHLRDEDVMHAVLPETARHFARAIAMPNLVPPVITGQDAAAYRDRILAAVPEGMTFMPLMTLYLTEDIDPEDVRAAFTSGIATAGKLYPAGATTNSASGVRDINNIRHVLEVMAEIGMPMCVHGEVADPDSDIFDREALFIDQVLDPLRQSLPELKIVMEHLTTKAAVDYVGSADRNLGSTITTHHLMINRNRVLEGGLKPHFYCMPIAKRESDRLALVAAATSGDPRYFLGTDSAPHVDAAKETGKAAAGIFTATNTMSCLAHIFEQEGALDRLEGFASLHGPAFYGLPVNTDTITLTKGAPVNYPDKIATGAGPVTVFDPAIELLWRVV